VSLKSYVSAYLLNGNMNIGLFSFSESFGGKYY